MTKFKLMQIYAKFFNPFRSFHKNNFERDSNFNVHGSRKARFIPADKWQSLTPMQRKAI